MIVFSEKYTPLFWQVIRFGMIGVLAALVHISLIFFLVQQMKYQPLNANIFSFLLASQVSFWGHRLWTFKETLMPNYVTLPKHFVLQVINFIANEGLFYFFLKLHFPYLSAILLVLTILPIFTFMINKKWIF